MGHGEDTKEFLKYCEHIIQRMPHSFIRRVFGWEVNIFLEMLFPFFLFLICNCWNSFPKGVKLKNIFPLQRNGCHVFLSICQLTLLFHLSSSNIFLFPFLFNFSFEQAKENNGTFLFFLEKYCLSRKIIFHQKSLSPNQIKPSCTRLTSLCLSG